MFDIILPFAVQLTRQSIRYTTLFVTAVIAAERPKKPSPPAILIAELERQVASGKESLRKEEYEHDALQQKLLLLESTLQGKERLLYEERMKTRDWKLQVSKLTLSWNEQLDAEKLELQKAAIAAVVENQQRLLRGLLSEHLRCRRIIISNKNEQQNKNKARVKRTTTGTNGTRHSSKTRRYRKRTSAGSSGASHHSG